MKQKLKSIIEGAEKYKGNLYEADGSTIEIMCDQGKLDVTLRTLGHKEILANGGEQVMRERHGDHFSADDRSIKLSIDLNTCGQISKIPKDATDEQKEQIQQ